MNIVVLDGYALNPGDLSWARLEKAGSLRVYDRTEPEDVIKRIGESEIVFTNKTHIDREVIEACKNIRYIGVLATGYDIVDIQTATQRNITVTNVPTYGTSAVSQFAIAMLLEICHHIAHHSDAVHAGRWSQCPDFCFWDYPLIELAGKTMGIMGFGRIGQATGRIARALGMQVLACDRFESETGREIACYVDKNELFEKSDIIALHCPLLPETKELINRESIARMKDGVIILNNSRGPLVSEQDLADALKSGKVYAAALDVVSIEPIQSDNPLLTAPNCLITPHISWASRESRERLLATAMSNLEAYLEGTPVNKVN